MTEASYLACSTASVFLYMTFLFFLALIKKDNSIVDVGWGIGFILVWTVTFFLEPGGTAGQLLAGGLVIIWGVRLAAHIFVRNKGRGEDFRYTRWRKKWGKAFVPGALSRFSCSRASSSCSSLTRSSLSTGRLKEPWGPWTPSAFSSGCPVSLLRSSVMPSSDVLNGNQGTKAGS